MEKLNMIKMPAVLFLIAVFTLMPEVSAAQTTRPAILEYTLPEFRDISVWKNRAGLALFSSDGKYLAVSAKTTDVVIYSTQTGEIKSKIDGDGFRAFSFGPDSKLAVAQNMLDQSLHIYDVET